MNDKKSFWLWLLQRITAPLILLALAAHLYLVHYAELGRPILYAGVKLRLENLFALLADSLLLILGLFHGLNGTRTVLLDFAPLARYERQISWLLFIIGLLFFSWGGRLLWSFLIR